MLADNGNGNILNNPNLPPPKMPSVDTAGSKKGSIMEHASVTNRGGVQDSKLGHHEIDGPSAAQLADSFKNKTPHKSKTNFGKSSAKKDPEFEAWDADE
jgi:hypothetical protein